MKKLKSIVTLLCITVCGMASAAEFTPLNFDDAAYVPVETQKIASSTTSQQTAKNAAVSVTKDTTGNKNMQSAITQLDNAQVEVRNELLNYKTKYSEIDAKYNTVKSERSDLSKKIRACEKKIKQLDRAKDKIRKNMV
jgi:chromosome segregation ATPase